METAIELKEFDGSEAGRQAGNAVAPGNRALSPESGVRWFVEATFAGTRAARRILIAEAVMIPARVKSEIFQHLQILLDRLIEGGQVIADHQRAGAGHEDEALSVPEIHCASARDHDFLARQDETETGDRL